MADDSSLLKFDGTGVIPGRYARITEEKVPEMVGMNTHGKFTSVSAEIKAGAIIPEDAVRRANEEFAKRQGRKFVLPSIEAREASYDRSCAEREMFDRAKIPFMFPNFTPDDDFYLSHGLTLVGAMTGKGKSTAAANVLAGFITHCQGTALVISNEEATDAIIHRTACVLLKKPYMKFHDRTMFTREMNEVKDFAKSTVLPRLVVVNDSQWDTTCLEDVQLILEGSAAQNVSLILADYWQTINKSKDFPDMEPFKVLKKGGTFLREYGRRAPVPVVAFVQLNPKSSSSDFSERVQHDKTIANDAFNIIEIEPDYETKLTNFTIVKQRFGASQGVKVSLTFNCGRYEQIGNVGL